MTFKTIYQYIIDELASSSEVGFVGKEIKRSRPIKLNETYETPDIMTEKLFLKNKLKLL